MIPGLERLRVGQRVAQDQPAFGVGIQDLHRAAGGGGDDIARTRRVAARHILGGGDDGHQVDRQLGLDRGLGRPRTAAAPHMSNFISSIAPGGLMEMPPVSNVMPLPTSDIGGVDALVPL